MKKVLMVVHEMNRGGIENFIMNLYRSIDREIIQFDFVVHVNKVCEFDDEIASLGGTIYHCPDYRVVNHIAYSKWWNSFFRQHPEYKIVHSHLDSCANIHLRIAKKYGLITIAHSHSSCEGSGIRAIVKSMLKIDFNSCCDYKFACSKAAADWLYGKESKNAVIINNGIDSEKFIFNPAVRANIRSELGISDCEVVIGHVGRIDKNKNQSFVIDIVKSLNDAGVSSTLVSVGKGAELENNIRKAKSLGIEEKVIFLGLRDDVNDVLQAFDVFVFPSLYEGLGLAVVEAQASGLPCLISDTITDEVSCTKSVFFMSRDLAPEEWAKEVVKLLQFERVNTQENIIRAGYDIKSTEKQLTDFYLEL